MLPSKSCKTINANFLLKNFGLTFFDRFKTGTYLVNWFGRGSADRTFRFGGSAEPLDQKVMLPDVSKTHIMQANNDSLHLGLIKYR